VFAGELHISEFVLYGVFVDHVLEDIAPFDGPVCHNYCERVPLSEADARAFAERMPANGLGAMILSHSATPGHVRTNAFRWCAQRMGRTGLPSAVRSSLERRCMDAAMLLAHVIAGAPAV
jgi:hypothetical protein